MDKPERIIILSTPGTVGDDLLASLRQSLGLGLVVTLLDQQASQGFPGDSLQNVIRWHEDMEFVTQEEKSLQPTNPYFGKEKWKKNRK